MRNATIVPYRLRAEYHKITTLTKKLIGNKYGAAKHISMFWYFNIDKSVTGVGFIIYTDHHLPLS